MRFGVVILPDRRWRDGAERWRQAEELTFDSAWTYDHLWWRSLSDDPWFAAMPVLAAAAVVTQRINLGTLVATPNFRHPAALAKEAMTIDDLSDGRFILGIGSGSPDAGDGTILSMGPLTPGERRARFEEFTALTDQLRRGPTTAFAGDHYVVDDAQMLPGSIHEPLLPLAVAASGPRGIDLAARYGDAWVTMGPTDWSRNYDADECAAIVAAQSKRLDAACERMGRPPTSIDRIFVSTPWAGDPLLSIDAFIAMIERYERIGITDLLVHWPRERGVYAGEPDAMAKVATRAISRWRDGH